MEESSKKYKLPIVKIDGERVFTADHVLNQMMYQSCRIDTAKSIAKVSLVLAIIAIGIAAFCLITMLKH